MLGSLKEIVNIEELVIKSFNGSTLTSLILLKRIDRVTEDVWMVRSTPPGSKMFPVSCTSREMKKLWNKSVSTVRMPVSTVRMPVSTVKIIVSTVKMSVTTVKMSVTTVKMSVSTVKISVFRTTRDA